VAYYDISRQARGTIPRGYLFVVVIVVVVVIKAFATGTLRIPTTSTIGTTISTTTGTTISTTGTIGARPII